METSAIKTNIGSEFRCGPVVDAIVANLTVPEKFRLLRQIKKKTRKGSPGSAIRMSGWKDSIERAFRNQRTIWCSSYGEISQKFYSNGQQLAIPLEWLGYRQLNKFKQLLVYCPNLTGIHLTDGSRRSDGVDERIFDVIRTGAANLTSLTFDVEHSGKSDELMKIFRKRKGKMEYIWNQWLKLNYLRELIETNPKLKLMFAYDMRMDFERKDLYLSWSMIHVPREFGPSGSIAALCSYFQTCNLNYKKSSANGVRLKRFHMGEDISTLNFHEITTFVDLEKLDIAFNRENFHTYESSIAKLNVMKNMKILTLGVTGQMYDDTQHIGQLLPNFSNLEELNLINVFISESTMRQLHLICPHLKRVNICKNRLPILTEETITEIANMSKLEYFKYWSSGNYWPLVTKRMSIDWKLNSG